MPDKYTILIVEDDESLNRALTIFLKKQGYRCISVTNGQEAAERYAAAAPHLVILDVMLPGLSGWQLLKRLRREHETPVIMLTALSEEYDLLEGFGLGADDYITKPFSLKEVAARVGAVLARSYKRPKQSGRIHYKGLSFDPDTRRVTVSGKEVELTKKEWGLLQLFLEHPNIVFSRESIIRSVWADSDVNDIRTVDTHIKQLRSKLGRYGNCIRTVWGVGYRFVAEHKE